MNRVITEATYDRRLHGVAQMIRLYEAARLVPDSLVPNPVALPMPPQGAAQRVGLNYALDTIQTWAAQIEAGASHLSNETEDAVHRTPRQLCIERARFAGDLARAQQLGFIR